MSNSNTTATEAQQQADAVRAIPNASQLIRNAVAAALPVAPEQYIAISVPGTVIDTTAIGDGGSYVYNAAISPSIPDAVQQAQAKLVDNMVRLAEGEFRSFSFPLLAPLPFAFYFGVFSQTFHCLFDIVRFRVEFIEVPIADENMIKSYHSKSSRSDFHMNTTAEGVSIEFAAPQIIAWVSQILPALPRPVRFEPMVQNTIPQSQGGCSSW